MSKPSLSETLQLMAQQNDSSRSETARLRDVFADVEKAIQKGVSRKAILEALHEDGFTMSLKMFDKALYRIRKSMTTKQPGLTSSVQVKETRIKTPQNGERRREDFIHNTIPDKTRIYGES